MKEIPSLPLEAESERLMRTIEQMLRVDDVSEESFGLDVSLQMEKIPERMRGKQDWPYTGDIEKRGGQKLRRWQVRDGRPSLDMLVPILRAFPKKWRERWLTEFTSLFNGRFVEQPDSQHGLTSFAEHLRCTGDQISALAHVFADNYINEHDCREKLIDARHQLLLGQSRVQSLITRIDEALMKQNAVVSGEFPQRAA